MRALPDTRSIRDRIRWWGIQWVLHLPYVHSRVLAADAQMFPTDAARQRHWQGMLADVRRQEPYAHEWEALQREVAELVAQMARDA